MDKTPDRTTLRAWFAFGLRLLGFWEILVAAAYFLSGLNLSMGLTKPISSLGAASFGSYMTHTFGHLLLALWLVKWAPNIARFLYPDIPPHKDDSAETP
jgi:peptidoglycan/LPS O-acetylase OafA/YrhL